MSCSCEEVESKGHKLLLLGFCNDKEVVGETEMRDSIWSVSFFHFFFMVLLIHNSPCDLGLDMAK